VSFVSDAVWISSWVCTEEELTALYSIASYYVCTSYCEGQNLPLLEAMSQGAIPISPRHTAMADYINDDNAIVLSSEVAQVPALSGHYRLWGQPTNVITAEEVERALHRSHALSAEARTELSRNAQRAVKEKFNSSVLSQALATVEQKLGVEIEA
jgi:glycosyltransferase involved in cell wall biosynthesis